MALEVALRYPARVERLILVDAAGTSTPWLHVPTAFVIAQVRSIHGLCLRFQLHHPRSPQFPSLAPIIAHICPRFVVERSVRAVYGDPGRIAGGVVDRYHDMARRAGNRRALFDRMAARREETYDASRLLTINIPTLVLWGGKDYLIPTGALL